MATTASDERIAYSIAETAVRLGVSRWLIYDGIRRGEIPARRIGRKVLIPASFFDRMAK